jgi:hypothetical protein
LQIYTLAANGVSGKQLGSKVACVQKESGASLQQKMQKKKPYGQLCCRQGQTRFLFFLKPYLLFLFQKKNQKSIVCESASLF